MKEILKHLKNNDSRRKVLEHWLPYEAFQYVVPKELNDIYLEETLIKAERDRIIQSILNDL